MIAGRTGHGAARPAIVLGAAVALLMAAAATASAVGGPAATAAKAATKTTRLYDVAPGFTPTTLTVKPGTKLVWKSERSNTTEHTVTLDKSAAPKKAKFFDSGDIGPGKSYSRTLTVKGSYLLYCKIHGGMFQTVKVR
ncbi:MAG: plastocyanin/azurin family copper-binding protein [Solirubrobacterales bacterium]